LERLNSELDERGQAQTLNCDAGRGSQIKLADEDEGAAALKQVESLATHTDKVCFVLWLVRNDAHHTHTHALAYRFYCRS
jgi:hypothetical protein